MEDRSALFNQLKNFSQRGLRKVETKVVTASGEQLVEKRGAKGLQVLSGDKSSGNQTDAEPPKKLDLQVGLVLPGFLLGSQDVAHDKSSLDSYGITHILNLDSGVENKYEDDYNYKNVNIHDNADFSLDKVFDDCFDFIDDGRHYGNVFIHCSGTIGLSRSTSICVAYLMNKEKQSFSDALNNVKEVRSFVKPNDGFVKQLKDYEVKLRGAQQVKDSGIDDPFALRKKQEIEQEKAMVAGAASVKNRMKMFGATLDTSGSNRSKSVSPSPMKSQPSQQQTPPTMSKWSEYNKTPPATEKTGTSKSMTPEPRSWSANKPTSDSNRASPGGPPPPPPPMPSKALHESPANKSSPLPPPPPPLPGNLMNKQTGSSSSTSIKSTSSSASNSKSGSSFKVAPLSTNNDNNSYDSSSPQETSKRTVFGRVPPPQMKIRGGLSVEKHDSVGDRNAFNSNKKTSPTSLQLPLKRQSTNDSSGSDPVERAPSPSAALRAAKQQAASKQQGSDRAGARSPTSDHRPSVCGQLNRSSTKKLLNLIKTKTKSDLTLPDGDENDEIEALLGALENESIDNIDWDELGLDEDEVKDIIEKGAANMSDSSGSSSSSSSGSSSEEETEEEEVETSTQHFVIRTK